MRNVRHWERTLAVHWRSQSRARGVSEGAQVTVILIKYDLVA